jgi:dihydrofolate synthase/folylpolyglutamate synthase
MTQTKFKSSGEIFEWLGRFINMEQGAAPPSMRPERMTLIAALAGRPELCAPAIHTAGSKGKGSVTAMASRILTAAGIRTARYLSPHVTEYRERITLDDAFFDEAVYIAAGEELRQVADTLCDTRSAAHRAMLDVSDGCGAEPTFFELLTLLYFLCARQADCKALAVETGMGGRLDPTNIADSAAAVITGIELEHTEFLGGTIAAVAAEKAGIIKTRRPLVLAEQSSNALAVFERTARERDAPLFYYPDTAVLSGLRVHADGTNFTLGFKRTGLSKTGLPETGLFDKPLDLSIGIPGEIQARNAALAVTAVKLAFPEVGAEDVRKGLAGFTMPARFERLRGSPPVIVDGAHTEQSVRHCVRTFTGLYGEGGVLLFGCASGKNDEAMARALLPHFSSVIITTPGTFKASGPEQVYMTFERIRAETGGKADISLVRETAAAIRLALDRAEKEGRPLLGIGSFYLAAEIRAAGAN